MSESRKTLRKAFHKMRAVLSHAWRSPERQSALLVAQMCSAKTRRRWTDEELHNYRVARQQGLSMQEATHAAMLASELETVSLSALLSRLNVSPELSRSLYTQYSPLRKRHKAAE